jgi:hypothetical protein
MAAKKKTAKSSRTKISKSTQKKRAGKKSAGKKASLRRSSRRTARKQTPRKTRAKAPKRRIRERDQVENRLATPSMSELFSGSQAGDLQGISRRPAADSESVDELLEEGNTFEAGVVNGVEEAGEGEPREVHTHEVPEDDVPSEYLDED